MVRKSGKGGAKDNGGEDDTALWADFARDIKPISKKPVSLPDKPAPRRTAEKQVAPLTERAVPKTVPKQAPQLDGTTQAKLQKGKIPIEGRLDLHGYTQVEAQDALETFVLRAAKAGKRCLLVITGKGLAKGEGILRQRLPQWIALSPLSDVVLKAVPAAPKDGGTGAFYLYLKRQR